jgi:hypothetical protein
MREQEVEALNAEPYAHHWFGKTVGRQWSEPKSKCERKILDEQKESGRSIHHVPYLRLDHSSIRAEPGAQIQF